MYRLETTLTATNESGPAIDEFKREVESAYTEVEKLDGKTASTNLTLNLEQFNANLQRANAELDSFSQRTAQAKASLDTSGVDQGKARVDTALASINGQKATASADVDTGSAVEKTGAVQRLLDHINGQKANANIDVDTSGATAKIGTIQALLTAFGAQRVTAHADVDTNAATTGLKQLTIAANDTRNAFGEFNDKLRITQEIAGQFWETAHFHIIAAGLATLPALTTSAGAGLISLSSALSEAAVGFGEVGAAGIAGAAGLKAYAGIVGVAIENALGLSKGFGSVSAEAAQSEKAVKSAETAVKQAAKGYGDMTIAQQQLADAQQYAVRATQLQVEWQEKYGEQANKLQSTIEDLRLGFVEMASDISGKTLPVLTAFAQAGLENLPRLKAPLEELVTQINAVGYAFLSAATSSQEMNIIQNVLMHIASSAGTLADILANALLAAVNVFNQALGPGEQLLRLVDYLTIQFRVWSASVEGQKEMATFFNSAAIAAWNLVQGVVDLVAGLLHIGEALNQSGLTTTLTAGLNDALAGFRAITAEGTKGFEAIKQYGMDSIPLFQSIGNLLVTIGKEWLTMAQNILTAKDASTGLNILSEVIGAIAAALPTVREGFESAFSIIGPAVARLVPEVAQLFNTFAQATPVMGHFIDIIAEAAHWFNALPDSVKNTIGAMTEASFVGGALVGIISKIISPLTSMVGLFGTVARPIAVFALEAEEGATALGLFGGAISALLGPVGLVIAGVAAAGVALYLFFTRTETGQTIIRALGVVISGVASAFSAAGRLILAALTPVWQTIQRGWSILSGLASIADHAVAGILQAFGRLAQGGGIRQFFSDLYNVAATALSSLRTLVVTQVTQIFGPQIGQILNSALHGNFSQAFAQLGTYIQGQLQNWRQWAIDGALNFVRSVAQGLIGLPATVGNALSRVTGIVGSGIRNWVSQIDPNLRDGNAKIDAGIKGWLTNIDSNLRSGNSKIDAGIKQWVTHIDPNLRDGNAKIDAAIKGWLTNVDSDLRDGNSKIDSGIKDWVSRIDPALRDGNQQIDSGVSSWVTTLNTNLQDGNSKIDDFVSNVHTSLDNLRTQGIYDIAYFTFSVVKHLQDDLPQGNAEIDTAVNGWLSELDTNLRTGNTTMDTRVTDWITHLSTNLPKGNDELDQNITTWLQHLDSGLRDGNTRMDTGISNWVSTLNSNLQTGNSDIDTFVSNAGTSIANFVTDADGSNERFSASVDEWFGQAKDDAIYYAGALADGVIEWISGLPGRLWGYMQSVYHAIVDPIQQAYNDVYGHSIVPDMVNGILAEHDRMQKGLRDRQKGTHDAMVQPFKDAHQSLFGPDGLFGKDGLFGQGGLFGSSGAGGTTGGAAGGPSGTTTGPMGSASGAGTTGSSPSSTPSTTPGMQPGMGSTPGGSTDPNSTDPIALLQQIASNTAVLAQNQGQVSGAPTSLPGGDTSLGTSTGQPSGIIPGNPVAPIGTTDTQLAPGTQPLMNAGMGGGTGGGVAPDPMTQQPTVTTTTALPTAAPATAPATTPATSMATPLPSATGTAPTTTTQDPIQQAIAAGIYYLPTGEDYFQDNTVGGQLYNMGWRTTLYDRVDAMYPPGSPNYPSPEELQGQLPKPGLASAVPDPSTITTPTAAPAAAPAAYPTAAPAAYPTATTPGATAGGVTATYSNTNTTPQITSNVSNTGRGLSVGTGAGGGSTITGGSSGIGSGSSALGGGVGTGGTGGGAVSGGPVTITFGGGGPPTISSGAGAAPASPAIPQGTLPTGAAGSPVQTTDTQMPQVAQGVAQQAASTQTQTQALSSISQTLTQILQTLQQAVQSLSQLTGGTPVSPTSSTPTGGLATQAPSGAPTGVTPTPNLQGFADGGIVGEGHQFGSGSPLSNTDLENMARRHGMRQGHSSGVSSPRQPRMHVHTPGAKHGYVPANMGDRGVHILDEVAGMFGLRTVPFNKKRGSTIDAVVGGANADKRVPGHREMRNLHLPPDARLADPHESAGFAYGGIVGFQDGGIADLSDVRSTALRGGATGDAGLGRDSTHANTPRIHVWGEGDNHEIHLRGDTPPHEAIPIIQHMAQKYGRVAVHKNSQGGDFGDRGQGGHHPAAHHRHHHGHHGHHGHSGGHGGATQSGTSQMGAAHRNSIFGSGGLFPGGLFGSGSKSAMQQPMGSGTMGGGSSGPSMGSSGGSGGGAVSGGPVNITFGGSAAPAAAPASGGLAAPSAGTATSLPPLYSTPDPNNLGALPPGSTSPAPNTGTPTSSGAFQAGVDWLNSIVGTPYEIGTAGPDTYDCAGLWCSIVDVVTQGAATYNKWAGTEQFYAGLDGWSPGTVAGGLNIGVDLGGWGGPDDTHMAGDILGTPGESNSYYGMVMNNNNDSSAFGTQWNMPAPDGVTGSSSTGVPASGSTDPNSLIAQYFPADAVPMAEAIMSRESGGDPSAYNASGASGLFQIMPSTASGLGGDPSQLFDPTYNVQLAAQLYAQQGWAPWSETAYASGGITMGPQVGMMGERGPELVMPLSDPTAAHKFLDAIGGGGGGESLKHQRAINRNTANTATAGQKTLSALNQMQPQQTTTAQQGTKTANTLGAMSPPTSQTAQNTANTAAGIGTLGQQVGQLASTMGGCCGSGTTGAAPTTPGGMPTTGTPMGSGTGTPMGGATTGTPMGTGTGGNQDINVTGGGDGSNVQQQISRVNNTGSINGGGGGGGGGSGGASGGSMGGMSGGTSPTGMSSMPGASASPTSMSSGTGAAGSGTGHQTWIHAHEGENHQYKKVVERMQADQDRMRSELKDGLKKLNEDVVGAIQQPTRIADDSIGKLGKANYSGSLGAIGSSDGQRIQDAQQYRQHQKAGLLSN